MFIEGTTAGETLTGTRRDDTIIGAGGTDTVIAKGGNDTIVARGYINGMGGRDRYFSVDQFRLFLDNNYEVTTPDLGGGRDLLVLDEHDELFGGPGRNGFSEVDLGSGDDRVIVGNAEGGNVYLGEGADTAYILGETSLTFYLAKTYLSAEGPVPDRDADDIHYNAGAQEMIFFGFGAEDSLTIYGSGLNYRTAMDRLEFVGSTQRLTLFDGSTISITTDFDTALTQDQLKFVDDPLTVSQKVLVTGETEEERAIFGSLFDDVLKIKNGALFLGAGDDTGRGSGGNERLHGQDGDDRLVGRGGDDILRGGTGDDRLVAGAGNDLIATGEGADIVLAGAGADTVIAQGGSDLGDDRIVTGRGSDRIIFRDGMGEDDTIRTVSTGAGRDVITFDKAAGIFVLTDFRANGDKLDFAFLANVSANNAASSVENFLDSGRDALQARPDLGFAGTLYHFNSLDVIIQSASADRIDEGDIIF